MRYSSDFIRIIQRFSVRLIIVGDGNLEQYLKKSTPFWARVTFTGFINKEHLYNLYRIADVGVLLSLHEEFGYVALEMMMMGLPLVVSQTTGLSELLVNGKTGITVSLTHTEETKDKVIEQIKQAIINLLYNQKQLNDYQLSARQRFKENFELSHFKKMIESIYFQKENY